MIDIHTIDCHYLGRPRFAAAYLLVDGDEAAFVDNNTNHAVPRLLTALSEAGLVPEQVRLIIITHVHLDHAGGTSALANACPNATVLAHPRAARHVIDPTKLVSSASAVYGKERFASLYGTIQPVPASRVREVQDDESLSFGTQTLTFLHTRGHANHHFCIADDVSNVVFTGDAFGLIYPDLQGQGTFAFPSTSPTDFDAELARQSIRRLVDRQPRQVFPTHFGAVDDIAGSSAQLIKHLDFAEALLEEAARGGFPGNEIEGHIQLRLYDYFRQELGALAKDPATWDLVDLDLELNAQGIAFAADKKRLKAREVEQ